MRKKRKASQVVEPTLKDLYHRIKEMSTARHRALAAFIYMTGARISEIIGVKNKDGTYKVPPLRKENISFKYYRDRDLMLVRNVPCLKRRNEIPVRTIPIKTRDMLPFFRLFLIHYKRIPANGILFNLSRQRAWYIINKHLGLYNHYLIHLRTTHLVRDKNLSDHHLKQFRGWKDTRPAAIYVHLRWQDLANAMD